MLFVALIDSPAHHLFGTSRHADAIMLRRSTSFRRLINLHPGMSRETGARRPGLESGSAVTIVLVIAAFDGRLERL